MKRFLHIASAAILMVAAASTAKAQSQEPVGNEDAPMTSPINVTDQLPDYMVPVGEAVKNPSLYGIHPSESAPEVTPPGSPMAFSPEELIFREAVRQALGGTSPSMVRRWKEMMDENDRALARPVGDPPKPVSRSLQLSLKPGEKPPVVRLYNGNATTLTFSDITGQPWPVLSVTVGNPDAYDASVVGKGKGESVEDGGLNSNMVIVSPRKTHSYANNIVVTLVGHPVPITLSVETATTEVDYRLDISLQSRGPNAEFDVIQSSSLPPTNDSVMLAFLDGVPPQGARKVETSDRDVEAWQFDSMLYLRSNMEVLSPLYLDRAGNVSGTRVYELMYAPVVLFSRDGIMTSVTIEP
ncbi:DotH/IcmK family type IV secretion protein [Thalassospira xianhensis]|uniref:Intracellular multiplication protein IcmK n=1 Tax=Thalassospira xiamenensis TaxID=220697 RepID=A0A285TXU7_9PROT|nr:MULTISPECIES: DotH/IcmK family type IV secretion protein [Thalassospira]SOC27151.1 intracellular multiplication protein IcmK [Thalassospira xiamenensis]